MKGIYHLLALGLVLLVIFSNAEQAPTNPNYSQQIEPIFQLKCAHCHNHTTRQGGLNLENYSALMNGGKNGPAIVSGQSGESRLVKMLEGKIEPRMPLGDQMSAGEIKLIKDWIDAGATGPENNVSRSEPAPSTKVTETAHPIPEIKPAASINPPIAGLAYEPRGTLLAIGRYNEVQFIDEHHQARSIRFAKFSNQVRAIAFSPDGRLLAAAAGSPAQFGEFKIWRMPDQIELFSIRAHRDNIFALAFNHDGSILATCSYDKLIKLWDTSTGKEIRTLKDHTDAVFSIAFNPDGKTLASASADRTVKIWDVVTGQRLYTLSDALDAINSIAFHPNGQLLAGAGADRVIRLWELGKTDGKQIKSLIAHEDAINLIIFSPDGKTLVSTGADKQLKYWNSAELIQTHTLEPQSDWVYALAFSSDGKKLAVGRHNGTISFYDAVTGKNLAR